MMTEHWACMRLPWFFVPAFWCEKNSTARKFVFDNLGPDTCIPNWSDVTDPRFLREAPACDLLVAGFPCQSFSGAGLGEGVHDREGRGVIVLYILRYVKKHSPRIVILENVEGLVTDHRETLDNIVRALERMGYYVSWRLLNSSIHGAVPQRRVRVYIVAIKDFATRAEPTTCSEPATSGQSTTSGEPATRGIAWPTPVQCPGLHTILEKVGKRIDYEEYPFGTLTDKTKRKNLRLAVRKVVQHARQWNTDPTGYSLVADLGGTRLSMNWHLATCLTAHRGRGLSFWSIQHARPLTCKELCRLQGFNADEMKITVSDRQMGGLLGNGMTCTVLARVIAAAIQALESPCGSLPLTPAVGYDTGGGAHLNAARQRPAASGNETRAPLRRRVWRG